MSTSIQAFSSRHTAILPTTSDWFHIAGGLDIWYKTAEHFDPRPGAFKFDLGESPAAFQLKFFSRIYMTHSFRDWTSIKFGLRWRRGAL